MFLRNNNQFCSIEKNHSHPKNLRVITTSFTLDINQANQRNIDSSFRCAKFRMTKGVTSYNLFNLFNRVSEKAQCNHHKFDKILSLGYFTE